MRIPLLYRGEYSQWVERFMNYLEEQTDGEAMINSIKNGDQPLPRVTQVSIAETTSTEQPHLKDKSMWSDQEKRVQKIDQRFMNYLEEQTDGEAMINSIQNATNLLKTYEMLLKGRCVVLSMKCGYKKDNCELNYKFLNNLQPEWKQYGDVNDALGYKKKVVVVASDPLALVAEKTKKYYTKPTNNNLRTSSASSSANKKPEYVKSVEKKEDKKVDEKKRDMSKVKCYNCKKEGHFAKDCKKAKVKDYNFYKTKILLAKKDSDEQVLFAEDQAWMESSSDSDQEINANMVFMAKMEMVLSDSDKSSSSAEETIAEICLWIIDSGCSKHMTGNRALLTNFVEKFLRTVCFGNNDFAVIAGYGDVVIGSMPTKKVYYSTCFVRNENGVDLLTDDRSSNLYTIAHNEVASNSSTCLLAKASSSQSWLWHQCLSHLNFATINNFVKNNLVQGLPKMKFEKDHLCFAYEQGKIHRKHHKSKTDFASNKPLYLLHVDLCGPMRVESINGKRYVLVVVDDYSRTPQQNGVVKRRNQTLVKAARTMLIFTNLPLFL
nr:hypothetical protein [Tanacetum cinerariifolium]